MEQTAILDKNSQEDEHNHDHNHNHDHDHDHDHGEEGGSLTHLTLLVALGILVLMQVLDFGFKLRFNNGTNLIIYGCAFLLAGHQVLRIAYKKALHLDIFNEFFLMSMATIGAFSIGAYSEGVAVMVFYSIGEWFQDVAVDKAKRNIKSLLDLRPAQVDVVRNGKVISVKPEEIALGETIQVKPGERVALDGVLNSARASFDTAALTGESVPETIVSGGQVFAGMINLNLAAEIRVTASYKDSKLSRILEMVQDATARKSKTQLFISRFARIYTPIVFLLAVLVVGLPYFFVDDYVFSDWLYRGLVFLVISCPCALVVSIPLGYFGGIGLASKNGILFKGTNFLDVISKVDTIVLDKTGTLTKGIFEVQRVVCSGITEQAFLSTLSALERKSTHPIARAICKYTEGAENGVIVDSMEEIPGMGLQGIIAGQKVIAGNLKFLKNSGISYDLATEDLTDTVVGLGIDGKFAGFVVIADALKDDAKAAITGLHLRKLRVVMFSGDKHNVVQRIAKDLGITEYYGDLLPEQKVKQLERLRIEGRCLAFVGDGVNDAPVIALADVGIAMGGLGSDVAIETADIVIQNDQPSKIAVAIRIGKLTRNVVWQNICLAMLVKVLVLALGAGGLATLWEAVIADVGVALLAILNAVRIQRIKI
jgi:Cd2+/Zn2+-exporting ATPase